MWLAFLCLGVNKTSYRPETHIHVRFQEDTTFKHNNNASPLSTFAFSTMVKLVEQI
jgi:hypothetical protein